MSAKILRLIPRDAVNNTVVVLLSEVIGYSYSKYSPAGADYYLCTIALQLRGVGAVTSSGISAKEAIEAVETIEAYWESLAGERSNG